MGDGCWVMGHGSWVIGWFIGYIPLASFIKGEFREGKLILDCSEGAPLGQIVLKGRLWRKYQISNFKLLSNN